MALFFSCLMVGLVVIAVWKRNYKKETIDNILSEGNKKEWLRFYFQWDCGFMICYQRSSQLKMKKKESGQKPYM